jgi:chitinase
VVNKTNGISSLVAVDLFSGKGSTIGSLSIAQALGKPGYTGDDGAIIYSAPNPSLNTLYSLVSQPIGPDGITATSTPSLWLSDADFAAIYRRGTFAATNAAPTVALTSPVSGQLFAAASDIVLQATASDSDGTIAKVEFYQGSTKLGESGSAPYKFTWSQVAAGSYNLRARAIDNLGAATDSAPVNISVGGGQPRFTGAVALAGNVVQFTLMGDVGRSYLIQQSTDLATWSNLKTITNATGSVSFQDSGINNQPRRFYRAMLSR